MTTSAFDEARAALLRAGSIRRVEVWRGGAWVASSLPDLAVDEVYRMFEPDDGSLVDPSSPCCRVLSPARIPGADVKQLDGSPVEPGRYAIESESCPDPSTAGTP